MGDDLRSAVRPAIVLTILFALLTGIAYPLAMTGVAQLIFPAQANGSLVRDGGRVVGSTLIGQAFTSPGYFQTRPSAAGKGYDALASAGDELASIHRGLAEALEALRTATDWLLANGMADPLDALAGATPYLRLFSVVTGGWVMAMQAQTATRLLADATPADKDFYVGKVLTARFFCEQLLPQARGLVPAVTATNRDLAAADL